jgi:hypothetical protein
MMSLDGILLVVLRGMAKMEADPSLKNNVRLIKGDAAYQIDKDTLEVTRELVRMKKA